VIGCLFFWFVFFGQAKKMKNRKNLQIESKSSSFACLYALFLRVQEKKQEKGTPAAAPAFQAV
jgi:hypothetical protein